MFAETLFHFMLENLLLYSAYHIKYNLVEMFPFSSGSEFNPARIL